jgi:membrane protein DedA with SNARE-associated domain
VLHDFVEWYLGALDAGGYWLVAALMALESSIVPLPSEVVIPPAAHLAVSTGRMSLAGIVLAGTVGSWVGASLMYLAARALGRPLLLRYGRYVLLGAQQIERAENWSAHYGPMGVFVARLLPVIRHLIGIPAGILRLHYGWYSAATLLGSAIWSAVLCWVGVTAGADRALLAGDLRHLSAWLAGTALVLAALYYALVHRYMRGPGSPRA